MRAGGGPACSGRTPPSPCRTAGTLRRAAAGRDVSVTSHCRDLRGAARKRQPGAGRTCEAVEALRQPLAEEDDVGLHLRASGRSVWSALHAWEHAASEFGRTRPPWRSRSRFQPSQSSPMMASRTSSIGTGRPVLMQVAESKFPCAATILSRGSPAWVWTPNPRLNGAARPVPCPDMKIGRVHTIL